MKPQSILVVDDEQANAAKVAELLKQGGYAVSTVTDGFKALAACKVRVPDLILLDMYMPLMSGIDVFNRLKTEEKTRHIPVIFLKRKDEPAPPANFEQTFEENPLLMTPVEAQDVMMLVKTILKEKVLRDEIRKKESQIRELSLVDPLTSFKNQRFMMEFLKTELPQCQRYKKPLSLLLVEPDQLKEVQKSFGHRGVDSLLQQLAVIMQRQNRKSDVLAKTSQSEFAMVLTHTDKEGAVEVAERLRTVVSESTFTFSDKIAKVTVSIGVSQFSEQMDVEGSILLSHARAALAQARTSGGNVTLIAE